MDIKMISRRLFLPGLLLLTLILASCGGTAAPTASATSCSGHFELNGAEENEEGDMEMVTVLAGNLQLDVDETGAASGAYTDDEQVVSVVGQVTGQAVSLVFDLGDDTYAFGTGAMTHPIDECQGIAGGPAGGPETVSGSEAVESRKMSQVAKLALAPPSQEVIVMPMPWHYDNWIWTPGS